LDKLRSDRLVDGVSLDNLTETDDSKHGNSINKYASKSKLSDSNRTVRSELMTLDLQFSPTGHEFAVATTQGLQIFCLDDELLFVPLELDVEITPQTVDFTISQENYSKALLMSVFLGDKGMIQKVLESVKIENIQLVVRSLGEIKVLKEVLKFVTEAIVSNISIVPFDFVTNAHIFLEHFIKVGILSKLGIEYTARAWETDTNQSV